MTSAAPIPKLSSCSGVPSSRRGGSHRSDRRDDPARSEPRAVNVELEAFELVILRRPENARSYDEATLERIQREHLEYLGSLRDTGDIVANGPVTDQPDESLRGLAFYTTGSLETARLLAHEDPAVQAGRLSVEVMTWLCRPGMMARPGRRVTIPDP